ncbi:AI-2E family transporter [Desulfurella multipotens]|uniref:AI-2E family transporter n=1 Tax=Desulfurella TaxID=33001 RepID=UPI002357B150|nr:AI-2E family transporter [Desulfurella multipotens]
MIGLVYLLFFKVVFFTVILIFSYFLSESIYPFVKFTSRIGIPVWVSSLFGILFALSLIVFIFSLIVPVLIQQINKLDKSIPQLIVNLENVLNHLYYSILARFGWRREIIVFLNNLVSNIQTSAPSFALSSMFSIIKGLTALSALVITPIISYFMLVSRNYYRSSLKKFIYYVLGQPYLNVFIQIYEMSIGYIKGLLIIILLVTILTYIGFKIVGLDYSIIFAILSGLAYIVPYIGSIVAIIPPLFLAIAVNKSLLLTLEVGVVFISIHFIIGNIVAPLIFSKTININPLLALVAIIFFGELYGILGIIFAIPITGIIMIVYKNFEPILKNRREPND